MQSSEGGSDSAAPVALHTSASAQAPVVQPVPASQQVPYAQLGRLFPWRRDLFYWRMCFNPGFLYGGEDC